MKEQLSAFVDGELSDDAIKTLLSATKHRDDLLASWANYHLIGDVMRDNALLSQGFEQRVMAAIQAEPTVLAPRNAQPHSQNNQYAEASNDSWLLSVAASVAAVFFVGWIVLKGQLPSQPEHLTPSVSIAQVSPEQVEVAQIPAEYLLAHQSYAPSGISSYIQTASYSESAE